MEENTIETSEIEETTEVVESEGDSVVDEKSADKYKEEENVEEVRGAKKLFRIFDKFGDLFMLNIYFFVTCIPIITIGAAFTALYTVTNKMVTDKEGPVRQEYFKAFKSNIKQSTIIWIIDLVIFYLMYVQYAYISLNSNQTARILYIVLGFEFIFMVFAFPLQWPMVARYENTTFNLMRNSLVFALANLGTWFRMFFIWMFPVVLYYLNPRLLVYTWFLWGMILTAVFAYSCSLFLTKLYAKLEAPAEKNDK